MLEIDSGIAISIEIGTIVKSDIDIDFWHGRMVLMLIASVEGNVEENEVD